MRIRVERWGNSLAVRIPKPFAEEANVAQGSVVELRIEGGAMTMKRVAGEKWTLGRLLAGVTKTNLHGEEDFGGAIGREVW